MREGGDALHVIADAVGRILVGPDVDAHDAATPAPRIKPPKSRRMALVVEAHAVDHRRILGQRLAGLQRHDGDLDEHRSDLRR